MYARFRFPKLSLTNKIIIFGAGGVSLLFILLKAFYPALAQYFVFLTVMPKVFMPWQLITHFLLNIQIFSLLFHVLAIWMFGNVLEQAMGTKKYVISISLSTIISGLTYWILATNLKVGFPFMGMITGILTLLCAFAYFWPNSKIYLFGIFPVKSKWLVLGYGIIMLLSMTSGMSRASGLPMLITYASIFAGIITAMLYIHVVFLKYNFLKSFIGKFKNSIKPKPKSKEKYHRSKKTGSPAPGGDKVVEIREWERKQVDYLLEKVSKYGIKSLNKKEKEFLDKVSSDYSSEE